MACNLIRYYLCWVLGGVTWKGLRRRMKWAARLRVRVGVVSAHLQHRLRIAYYVLPTELATLSNLSEVCLEVFFLYLRYEAT